MVVTFVTNGGTSVTKLENVEELPTPLPTTTKANSIFVGWFYDSGFEEQAFSGDTISSNITLYAKWYANMEDFYEDVADAIRSKNGETELIKHTDFAYKIKNIQGAKPEETKTVTPDFSSGNVVVTPTSGKVLSQVTINKDGNLVAENIKKDITVNGITGTLEGGGAEITGANEIDVIAQDNINKGDTVRVTAGTTGIYVETTPTTLPAGNGYGCAFNHDGTRLAVAHDSSPYITAYGVLYDTPLAYKANNLLSGLAGRYGYAKENISLSAIGKVDVLFEV